MMRGMDEQGMKWKGPDEILMRIEGAGEGGSPEAV